MTPADTDPDSTGMITGGYGLDTGSTGANKLSNFPLNFLRSGRYHYSQATLDNRTTDGRWWSSAWRSTTGSYRLYTNTSAITPQGNTSRGYGVALRCVALE